MLILRRGRASVLVESDLATEAWVRMRSERFFEMSVSVDAACSWSVAGGVEHAPPAEDYVRHEIRYDSGEHCDVLISLTRRVLAVDLPPGPWRSVYVLRAVRNLLRWQLQAQSNPVFLHGAGLMHEPTGKGICLIGPSLAGKSTLSLALLGPCWGWVSQDDLCVVEMPLGSWMLLGWPGSLRLRRDALALFPSFAAKEFTFTHPANRLEAKPSVTNSRLHIFPEELSRALGCPIRGEAPVCAIAVLDPESEDDDLRPLSPEEITDALFQAWDVLPERRAGRRVADVFAGRRDWSNLPFFPLLLEYFGLPNIEVIEQKLTALASAVPGWRVSRHTLLRSTGVGQGFWQSSDGHRK